MAILGEALHGPGYLANRGDFGRGVDDLPGVTPQLRCCQECVRACPYGVMSFDPRTQHADKCTLSAERRAAGLPPACVSVCPTNAIVWGPVEELHGQTRAGGRVERSVDHFGLDPSTIYLEHMATRLN